jgi:hypothetical protein
MSSIHRRNAALVLAVAGFALGGASAKAAGPVKDVFVISMENHNWTQPAGGSPAPIFQNANAPFINHLVDGTSTYSSQVSFATQYHNAGSTHPSEPNYIWAEAGSALGVTSDNDPYATSGGTNQTTTQHLSTLLSNAGVSWKSYQEDIDTDATTGSVLAQSQWTVPLKSRAGTYTTATNPVTGSKNYDYAAKHNPMLFFSDTNGGNNTTTSNPARTNYAPLQQFYTDLTDNTVSRYNWITPDVYDDMHTGLPSGYKTLTGDNAAIKQGDDFLTSIVAKITASQAYQDNGAIIIWFDETEGGSGSDRTIPEIIISPLAHPNVGGVPYSNAINYTHSSDLKTMQEIFGVGPYLGDAATAGTNDLRDLFAPGAIPTGIPEPGTLCLMGIAGVFALRRRRIRSR